MEQPRYRQLVVWKKAHHNALLIIEVMQGCSSKYARISDQCLGAATSIGANIAEGNCARSVREKKRYFEIALNSSYELDNWLQILKDSDILLAEKGRIQLVEKENIEVIKMLTAFNAKMTI